MLDPTGPMLASSLPGEGSNTAVGFSNAAHLSSFSQRGRSLSAGVMRHFLAALRYYLQTHAIRKYHPALEWKVSAINHPAMYRPHSNVQFGRLCFCPNVAEQDFQKSKLALGASRLAHY